MTKKVLTIGGAVRDLFLEYENPYTLELDNRTYILLEEGRKFDLNKLSIHVGGGGANSASSFKQLGFDVQAFFKVGNDHDGTFILESLQSRGVQTNYAIVADNVQTGISCIIPTPSGNRTVLVYRGANATLQSDEIPFDAIDNCDQLYVTSLTDASSLQLLPITTHAKKCNKIVAVNPGGSQLRTHGATLCKSLLNIDIFILNSLEAKQLMYCFVQDQVVPEEQLVVLSASHAPDHEPTLLRVIMEYKQKSFSLRNYFKSILSQGPKIAVVTDGAQGVYVAHKDTIYFYPSLPVQVVSSIGAGDAFGSTFTAMLLHGKSIEDALIAGIIQASNVISSVGTQTGLAKLTDLQKQLAQADKTLLQKHVLK